jgi:hypothetical protein
VNLDFAKAHVLLKKKKKKRVTRHILVNTLGLPFLYRADVFVAASISGMSFRTWRWKP